MKLREIAFEDNERGRLDAIQENLEQQVILKDEHEGLCHGVLLREECDNEIYYIQIDDGRSKTRLHYHDLKLLFVIRNDPVYQRPSLYLKGEIV